MPEAPIPSPNTPLLGRGLAFRFDGLDDLGPLPEDIPTPREPVPLDGIEPASSAEGELPFLTIAEASSLIRSGELSPVELTRAILTRIERLNPTLNAYITVTADLALSQAKEAEKQIKKDGHRGPLHGIPISLKDLIATAGVLTTGGTGALADWIPTKDATVWRHLQASGAVLLGKVNLHEMAAGGTGLNQFYGPSRNPWDVSRVTGGSSSGSAAAIAAHLCLASIGSDTGGSIRGPSSLCGIVGLKPTFGLVSTKGGLYLAWTNDHLGPMTKTVEDAAIVLNAIAGYDPDYALSAPVATEDYTAQLNGDLKGMRIAVPTNYFWELQMADDGGSVRMGADPDVVKTVRAAINVLKDLGAEVTEIEIEGLDDLLGGPNTGLSPIERAFFLDELPQERKDRFSRRYLDGNVRANDAKAMDYLRNVERAYKVQVALESALQPFDAYALPTTPIVAPTIAAAEASSTRADQAAAAAAAAGQSAPTSRERGPTGAILRYTGPFNRSGQPALSVPCGFSREGLPIGMMIVGKRFTEPTVLRIGHAYEQATEWHKRRPPLP